MVGRGAFYGTYPYTAIYDRSDGLLVGNRNGADKAGMRIRCCTHHLSGTEDR